MKDCLNYDYVIITTMKNNFQTKRFFAGDKFNYYCRVGGGDLLGHYTGAK